MVQIVSSKASPTTRWQFVVSQEPLTDPLVDGGLAHLEVLRCLLDREPLLMFGLVSHLAA
jgi:hypothetical protein